MTIPSLLRRAEHKALSSVVLSGKVLDLGGTGHAEYQAFLKGTFEVMTVNMDPKASPDLLHDLEKPVPLPDASFDHVLLINVLEHVFEYRQLLAEATRIVRPGGSVIVIVPFLFPIHPDPHDFWRFSKETLLRELRAQDLSSITVQPLGSGVFTARYVMLDRLLPSFIRMIGNYTFCYIAYAADALFSALAHVLGKKYDPADYALGYSVLARKI